MLLLACDTRAQMRVPVESWIWEKLSCHLNWSSWRFLPKKLYTLRVTRTHTISSARSDCGSHRREAGLKKNRIIHLVVT